jgi:hypothetical protein
MKHNPALLLLPIVLFIAAACGGDSDSKPQESTEAPKGAAATATRDPARVPVATLRASSGREVRGGTGTRCWARVCAESSGPVTNSVPLQVGVDERLTLSFDAGQPSSLASAWVPAAAQAPSTVSDGSVWPGIKPELTKQDAGPIVPEAGTGRFIYVVQAVWDGRGDVTYGFYVERTESK